jgi:phosphatidylethanolamine-binding protein (PEBP) family uncharacterized protein
VQLEQGVNDFGHARYDGPCPPTGHGTHHYHFRLAALDTPRLVLSPGNRGSRRLAGGRTAHSGRN